MQVAPVQITQQTRKCFQTLRPLFHAAIFLAPLAIAAQAFAQQQNLEYVTFQVPAAGSSNGQGTVPRSINVFGSITGEYYDSNGVAHGFARTPDGIITTFDAPGASMAQGQGTYPGSINPLGVIAGFYYFGGSSVSSAPSAVSNAPSVDALFATRPEMLYYPRLWRLRRNIASSTPPGVYTRGFILNADGSITAFDAGPDLGTIPAAINLEGTVTGSYSSEGFVRAPDDIITTFGIGVFTVPTSINLWGQVTGWYDDSSFLCHGFLRAPEGSIVIFDPAGSVCTIAESINVFGVITGEYSDSSGASHGFVRAPNGAITTFDVRAAGHKQDTSASSINDFGIVTGTYIDSSGVVHGFVRAADGTIITFNAPGAEAPFQGDGTSPQSNNLWGTITGWFSNASGTYNGFVRRGLYAGAEK